MDQTRSAILSTLCYSDIFDYPLTKAEIWRYLACKKSPSFQEFQKTLQEIAEIKKQDNYYYLTRRKNIVTQRIEKEKISKNKLLSALPTLRLIQKIPTVDLIGISGSLALQNGDKNADIDIFVIAKKNTLWITRLLILFVLEIKQIRRKRKNQKSKNMICLNMLIDTHHLTFSKNRQDFYTAHEILQMRVLFSRGYTYEIFLKMNAWIENFLPNGFPRQVKQVTEKINKKSLFTLLEPVAEFFQLWYMKNHITRETIANGFVAFHPYDYKKTTLDLYEKRKKKYGIYI